MKKVLIHAGPNDPVSRALLSGVPSGVELREHDGSIPVRVVPTFVLIDAGKIVGRVEAPTSWGDAMAVAPGPPEPSLPAPAPSSPTEIELARIDLRTQADAALTRLDDIATNGGTYTATQTREAVLDLARVLRRTLRYTRGL